MIPLRFMIFAAIGILICSMDSGEAAEQRIRCASTTSTRNSGLFDHILPRFTKKTGITIDVIAVGTGAAIEIGKRGDADVVFVHAKEQELKAVQEGFFVNRRDVMYNDFVLIGPPADPASVRGVRSAAEAFRKIALARQFFVSRGDQSGTHTKELYLWRKASMAPQGQRWYLEVGQGMEKAQRIADEKRAYTLTDRGTWLATKDKDQLDMAIVLEGDPELFNQYGVMAVNPERHRHVRYREAKEFVQWLVSKEGQEAIGSFTDKNGNRLFTPNAR